MTDQLYFFLEPYVYYSIGPDRMILVNLLDDKLLYFTDTKSIKIIESIHVSNNRVALIEKSDFKTPVVSQSIQNFMGDVVKTNNLPLQFDSEINNLSGKDAYRKSIKFTRYGIGSFISECYIITDLKRLSSVKLLQLLSGIDNIPKQNFIKEVMSPLIIEKVINEISHVNPSIRFFITDPNEENLKSLLLHNKRSENIIPIYSFETLHESPSLYQYLIENNISFKLIITSFIPFEELEFNKTNVTLMLGIKDKKEVEYYCDLKENDYNVELYPILTNDNVSFILSLFDWSLDELNDLKDKYKKIKQNSVINTNMWGRIFVNPIGNISYSPLEMNNDYNFNGNFFELFHQTLIKGDFAWTRTREYPQCRDCCFQRLCPSPSPVEDYLRENLKWRCNLLNI